MGAFVSSKVAIWARAIRQRQRLRTRIRTRIRMRIRIRTRTRIARVRIDFKRPTLSSLEKLYQASATRVLHKLNNNNNKCTNSSKVSFIVSSDLAARIWVRSSSWALVRFGFGFGFGFVCFCGFGFVSVGLFPFVCLLIYVFFGESRWPWAIKQRRKVIYEPRNRIKVSH